MTPSVFTESAKTGLIYIDVLRIMAIVLVITGHVCIDLTEYEAMQTWLKAGIVGAFFGSFCINSLPIFIMLSGMLLLDKSNHESLAIFYKKRVKKVLIPFIAWLFLYYAYYLTIRGDQFSALGFVRELLVGWNTDHIPWHLWYLLMILSLYIFTPIIRAITDNLDRKVLIGFLGILFVYEFIFPLIGELFQIELGLYTYKSLSSIYLFYYLLGFVLSTREHKDNNGSLFAIFVVGYLTTFLGTVYAFLNGYNASLYNTNRLNVLIMVISIFLLIKNLCGATLKRAVLISAIRKIGSMTFGIYLVHIMIMSSLGRGDFGIRVTRDLVNPLIGIPVLTTVVFLLSLLAVYVMKKIPIIKEIVP